MRVRITDLAQKQITNKDSLRIINLYPAIVDNTNSLPEWTNECKIIVQSEDGTDYQSTIASLIKYIKTNIKENSK